MCGLFAPGRGLGRPSQQRSKRGPSLSQTPARRTQPPGLIRCPTAVGTLRWGREPGVLGARRPLSSRGDSTETKETPVGQRPTGKGHVASGGRRSGGLAWGGVGRVQTRWAGVGSGSPPAAVPLPGPWLRAGWPSGLSVRVTLTCVPTLRRRSMWKLRFARQGGRGPGRFPPHPAWTLLFRVGRAGDGTAWGAGTGGGRWSPWPPGPEPAADADGSSPGAEQALQQPSGP